MLFFSQHRGFAACLLLATWVHPWAGGAGLAAAGVAVGLAGAGGFRREPTALGAYSFNSLLVGLALGTLYQPGPTWAVVVVIGAVLAFGVSVVLAGWLGARGLPILSLPFVAVMWLIGPGAGHFLHLPANEAGIYWLNDLYAVGGMGLVELAQWVSDWSWPPTLLHFLRALSAILIQDDAIAGGLVAVGLLWHSRIAFSLVVLAFLAATGLNGVLPALVGTAGTYDLGANYLMTALAVGAVFLVPRPGAYALALGTVPLTAVVLGGIATVVGKAGLPVYSLPFCLTSLGLLYALLLREAPSRHLPLTPLQRYSPEHNLYAYTIDHQRLAAQLYLPLHLPLMGEWRCSQAYTDGGPTHQGDWGQALDFVIADADGRTYHGAGTALADYYCFDKPVLAPADGVVEEVVDHVDDNAIGHVNTRQNWGNTVVLRHAPGLYTQLSHLRRHSVRVKPGDAVRRGDVLATCGSSGRSPEPHLHVQVQATPSVGSRTLAYPLAAFLAKADGDAAPRLRRFGVPVAGETVSPAVPHRLLSQALKLPPGYALDVQQTGPDGQPTGPAQRWEVGTDAYNLSFLRCHATGAVAYFVRDATVFYFTAFYGAETSWLYLFYRAAWWLPLPHLPHAEITDALPLTVVRNPVLRFAQDLVAPFVQFLRPTFALRYDPTDNGGAGARSLTLHSRVVLAGLGRPRVKQESTLQFQDGALAALSIRQANHLLYLRCSPVTG